jgi:ATP-binding cassette subfamily F protein 3
MASASASSSSPSTTRLSSAAPAEAAGGGTSTTTATAAPPAQEEDGGGGSGPRRGDAGGAALRLEDVTVSRGGTAILRGITWRVEPRAKWALVGGNGCGKSTLLKAVVGEVLPDGGTITVGTTQTVGYLQQTAVAGSTRTVLEEASSAMAEIEAARRDLRRAEERVAAYQQQQQDGADSIRGSTPSSSSSSSSSSLERDLRALDRATQRYELVGGYQQEKEVTNMLRGLGFTNLTQRCDELSGGWQMRVSFAKLLLSKPSLCLLDEPGNHLDRPARAWLANYLRRYDDGAMVLVTHDRELLESCDHIAEIVSGTIQVYKSCTYSQYLALKEDRAKAAMSEYEKNQARAARLQGFVDRFGASATKASAAQSRVKQLEKMQAAGALEAPPEAVVTVERFRPSLLLPDPPKSIGEVLLALRGDAKVGHDERLPLISGISELEIKRGMKILIRGPNGAGECREALENFLDSFFPLGPVSLLWVRCRCVQILASIEFRFMLIGILISLSLSLFLSSSVREQARQR